MSRCHDVTRRHFAGLQLHNCGFDPRASVSSLIIREVAKGESVCEDLGLRMRDDDATRLVAEKVIKFAQWGIHDAATLRALTLKEFRPDFDARADSAAGRW